MDPINYRLDVKDPFEGAMRGVQTAIGLSDAIDQSKQRQLALQQAQNMQKDLADLSANPNPTAQDFARITTKYPQLAEHFKNTWQMLNTDQQQTALSNASQVYAALSAGQTDVAKDLLQKQKAGAENAGLKQQADSAEAMLRIIDMNPKAALHSVGISLASILGPEKFAAGYNTISKTPGETVEANAKGQKTSYEAEQTPERLAIEQAQGRAQLKNIDSQIAERAGRLALDRDKLQTETQMKLYELQQKQTGLDESGKKLVNDSAMASVAAKQSASQMTDLANRLEANGGGYGAFGTASEWLKKATGSQDYMTTLRNEYARIRSGQVMKLLPPGPASDKDVAMAMKGFPPETADSAQISSFLRGMAKLQNYSAAMEGAKAEWVNSVGYLGKPKQDIEVDGVKVPAGTTFADFTRQYLDAKAVKEETESAKKNTDSRSYMRWATQ